jgi:hypothetical protein
MIMIWVARAEDVISRRIGDEMVVLKNTADSTHILNKTAGIPALISLPHG